MAAASVRTATLGAVLVCACMCVVGVFAASEIGFQVHSYNDLREWPQTLRKGATWLKIDPHYMPPEFCGSQPRVKDASRGCFPLNHDDPVADRKSYFVLDDVLGFATAPENIAYFQARTSLRGAVLFCVVFLFLVCVQRDERIFVALCFKYDDPCDGTEASANWTALVDDFFESANAAIADNGLNLEFILDGSATPTHTCLANRWRPWNATWIVSRDPFDAATSDDASKGYDRFAINNMPEGHPSYLFLEEMKQIRYGKFLERSMPYLLWEPSDQKSILEIATAYRNGPRHLQGFRFAINIDPVQFSVYAARTSSNAWNIQVPQPDPASMSSSARDVGPFGDPLVAAIKYSLFDGRDDTDSASIVLVINRASRSANDPAPAVVSIVRAFGADALGTDMAPVSDVIEIVAGGATGSLKGTSVVSAAVVGSSLVLADNVGSFVALSLVNRPLPSLAIVASGSLPVGNDEPLSHMSVAAAPHHHGKALIVNVVSSASCGVLFRAFVAPDSLSSFTAVDNGTLCLAADASSTASVAVAESAAGVCAEGQLSAVVTFTGADSTIMASIVCVSEASGAQLAASPTPLAVGSQSSVATTVTHLGEAAFAITIRDGFAYNTVHQNTQSEPALCDLKPTSTPNVLTYITGTLRGLAAQLASGEMASPCSLHTAHGTYDMGTSATSALLLRGNELSGSGDRSSIVTVVAVHTGTTADTKDVGGCGLPVPYDGTVLDGWDVDLSLWR